jgi:tRNA pseudouridine55 synthase
VNFSGVLNLDKKEGPTSHDVVARVRLLVPKKTKVGHAGTLDPMAEGVLPVCLGAATKLFPYLLECRKTYRATMVFGRVTDTQDITGKTLSEAEPGEVSLEAAQRFLDSFMGKSIQVPPMFSALKVGGMRLHELARAGVEVEREGRSIEVFGIRALDVDGPHLTFEVTCTRGTYIRVLCHDLGALQGAGGCMEALTRISLGPFDLKNAISLEEAEDLAREGRLQEAMMSLSDALGHLPAVTIGSESEERFRNGVPLGKNDCVLAGGIDPGKGKIRVLSAGGELIGVGRFLPPRRGEDGAGRINAERVFVR